MLGHRYYTRLFSRVFIPHSCTFFPYASIASRSPLTSLIELKLNFNLLKSISEISISGILEIINPVIMLPIKISDLHNLANGARLRDEISKTRCLRQCPNFHHQSSLHFSPSLYESSWFTKKKKEKKPRLFLRQSIIVNRSIYLRPKILSDQNSEHALITYLKRIFFRWTKMIKYDAYLSQNNSVFIFAIMFLTCSMFYVPLYPV